MAILAAAYGPVAERSAMSLTLLAAAFFAAKSVTPEAPWGLSFHTGTVQADAAPLAAYCELARGNELILVDLDDDLYASALPLSHLRYCLVGSNALAKSYALDFPDMGIVVTATQFNDLFRLEPLFRRHLREWGLDSSEPIGTWIAAAPEDLAGIIRAHPASDFFLPAQYRAAIEYAAGRSHDIWPALPAHVLLLSRQRVPRESPPAWSCRL